MSVRPNERTEARRKRYKLAVYTDKGRWRRENNLVEIRKNKREETLSKKRSLLQNKVGHTTMKKPAFVYLWFWAIVCVLALKSVHVLLNKTDQFSSHSSGLLQILTTFLYFSLSRVFLFNPSSPRDGTASKWSSFFCLVLQLLSKYMSIELMNDQIIFSSHLPLLLFTETFSIGPSKFYSLPYWLTFAAFDSIIYPYVDRLDAIPILPFAVDHTRILPFAVGLIIATLVSLYQHKLQSFATIKVPQNKKIIVGLIGNILANHFLKDKSSILFWLVVSLAIFWLGNMAMMQSSFQSGIFEFLVGVILDIAGELFGLNIYVWLVLVACLVLYYFFEHMDKINLQSYFAAAAAGGVDDHDTRIEGLSSSLFWVVLFWGLMLPGILCMLIGVILTFVYTVPPSIADLIISMGILFISPVLGVLGINEVHER